MILIHENTIKTVACKMVAIPAALAWCAVAPLTNMD